MKVGRIVYIPDENLMAEVVSQQLHGALVKFNKGGFERVIFLTADDYDEIEAFEEDE